MKSQTSLQTLISIKGIKPSASIFQKAGDSMHPQRQLVLRDSFWRSCMYGEGRELEIGNATSAVLISLLQTLVDKGIVSNAEVRALLTKAASDLGPHE